MSDRVVSCPACGERILSTEAGTTLALGGGVVRAPAPEQQGRMGGFKPYGGRSPYQPAPDTGGGEIAQPDANAGPSAPSSALGAVPRVLTGGDFAKVRSVLQTVTGQRSRDWRESVQSLSAANLRAVAEAMGWSGVLKALDAPVETAKEASGGSAPTLPAGFKWSVVDRTAAIHEVCGLKVPGIFALNATDRAKALNAHKCPQEESQ